MSESFVDLSYRGLALGKRIRLTQVRAGVGTLEMPTPMPVGTTIGIATDDGVVLEATVAEVHEQITGSERTPGMVVRPKLDAEVQRAWWRDRVTISEEKVAPQADADGKVTVRSRRMTGNDSIPELVDDGRSTAVIPIINDAAEPVVTIEAEPPDDTPLQDDGKRTMMMDAIDLAALGLDPAASSGAIPSAEVNSADSTSGPAVSDDDADSNGGKKKKKKKR